MKVENNGEGTVLPDAKNRKKKTHPVSASAETESLWREKKAAEAEAPLSPDLEERILLQLYGIPWHASAKFIHRAQPRGVKLSEVLSVLERLGAAGLIVKTKSATDPADNTWRGAKIKEKQFCAAMPVPANDAPPEHLHLALIALDQLYETALKQPFEQVTALLIGMRDLIAHHPELRDYNQALSMIIDGEAMMNHLTEKLDAI